MDILVIDDSAFSRMTIRHALEAKGFKIEEAPGVEEALVQLGTSPPQLIISDFMMHEFTGLDLLRKLAERGLGIPVIVLTADLQDATRDECMAAGARAVLHKPMNIDQLVTTVDQLLAS